MANINLLPWREKLRSQRQRDFGLLALGALLVTVLGVGYWGFFYVQGMVDHQRDRNRFIENEIAQVDKQIVEIEELERTRQKLIARMKVIENLQVSRPQIVHLFDELVTVLPDGAYLTSLAQTQRSLALNGRAQSNARVSAYMRNIESSPWLSAPKLKIIESKGKDKTAAVGSNFQLGLKQIVPKGGAAR